MVDFETLGMIHFVMLEMLQLISQNEIYIDIFIKYMIIFLIILVISFFIIQLFMDRPRLNRRLENRLSAAQRNRESNEEDQHARIIRVLRSQSLGNLRNANKASRPYSYYQFRTRTAVYLTEADRRLFETIIMRSNLNNGRFRLEERYVVRRGANGRGLRLIDLNSVDNKVVASEELVRMVELDRVTN